MSDRDVNEQDPLDNADTTQSINTGYQSLDPLDPALQSAANRMDDEDISEPVAGSKYEECCGCCNCDKCIITFSRFWLGCGTSQFGYSVIVWYIINTALDIYSLVTCKSIRLLIILYTFGVFSVDIPVLFFVVRDQQYKLVFPFCCQMAMGVISMIYFLDKEIDPTLIGAGGWTLLVNTLFDFLGALSLIPLMTHRVPLWDQTDIGYSRLYPYSSKYDREISIV